MLEHEQRIQEHRVVFDKSEKQQQVLQKQVTESESVAITHKQLLETERQNWRQSDETKNARLAELERQLVEASESNDDVACEQHRFETERQNWRHVDEAKDARIAELERQLREAVAVSNNAVRQGTTIGSVPAVVPPVRTKGELGLRLLR